jgi:hypothetical protein
MTRAAQPWHVDSSDYVALLCLAEAKEGGDSAWASSGAILNIIREESPELLPVLAGPWMLDRKGEAAGAGEGPVFEMPILHYHQVRVIGIERVLDVVSCNADAQTHKLSFKSTFNKHTQTLATTNQPNQTKPINKPTNKQTNRATPS